MAAGVPVKSHGGTAWWEATVSLSVAFIGIVTVLSVVCTTAILFGGNEAPEGLIAIGAGGVGALATLLTTQRGANIAAREELPTDAVSGD